MKLEKKAKKLVTILFLLFLFLANNTVTVKASGIKSIDAFDNLNGDAKYLGKDYRSNYYLDIEKTGLLDTAEKFANSVANGLFSVIRTIVYITVSMFYYSMSFDLGKLIQPQINGIQAALRKGIFEPLYYVGFAGISMSVIVKLYRRDVVGTINEFAKVVVLVLVSFFLVTQTSTVLSYGTGITKSVAVSALTGINSDKGVTNSGVYAADIAGVLWANLIQEPWKSFEFGDAIGGSGKVTDSTIDSFMSTKPGTKEREELVKNYMDANPDATSFNKNVAGLQRIPVLIVYLLVAIVKSAIYLFVSGIQLAFQAMAVFYLILAMIVLVMAMLPGYGMDSITNWLRKLLETQLGIIVITFVLGLLVKFDSLLYALVPDYGWFVVILLQIIIIVGIIWKRKEILKGLSNVHKGVSNPAYARALMRKGGNIYDRIGQGFSHNGGYRNRSLNTRRNEPNYGDNRGDNYRSNRNNTSGSGNGGGGNNGGGGDGGGGGSSANNTSAASTSSSTNVPRPRSIISQPSKEDADQTSASSTALQGGKNVVSFTDYKSQRATNRPRLYPEQSNGENESTKVNSPRYSKENVVRNAPIPASRIKIRNGSTVDSVDRTDDIPYSGSEPVNHRMNENMVERPRTTEEAVQAGIVEKRDQKKSTVDRPSLNTTTETTEKRNISSPSGSSGIPRIKSPEEKENRKYRVTNPTIAPQNHYRREVNDNSSYRSLEKTEKVNSTPQIQRPSIKEDININQTQKNADMGKIQSQGKEVRRPKLYNTEEKRETLKTSSDRVKVERVEGHNTKLEVVQKEQPKIERPKLERNITESPQTEKIKAEKPRTERARTEKSKIERPKTERPKTERPKTERPKTGRAKTERIKTSKTETSKNTKVNRPQVKNSTVERKAK